jgi:1,4-alpha-glucan branching enzyme
MQKLTLSLILFLNLLALSVYSQIITTNPAFITHDYNGEVTITYDAALGNAGLKGYTGDVYAHAGVITTDSKTDTDWKHAPAWGDNSAKYKLTSLGNDKWQLMITPNMKTYYNLAANEVLTKLAFVFRSGDKTKEGKDTGGADIFVPIYEAGLNVSISNPSGNLSVAPGTNVIFNIKSSVNARLQLHINGIQKANANNASMLNHAEIFTQANDYQVIASATLASETVYDTVMINVPTATVTQSRPVGAQAGINYNSNTSATLVLHAPNKNNVFLIGDFNNWSQLNTYQLKKDGEYWWITIDDLIPGKLYGFQYLVDGNIRISDPYTELVLDPWSDPWINEHHQRFPNLKEYPTGKTDGLVATLQTNQPAYNWEVPNFAMPNRENMVIYEMLLRDFTTEKSLEAAIGKLDYLKHLGITAVELLPIHEFDGNESWGYNPNHFFAPDKAYGTPDMYKKFIDECHKRGIAVILDVVFNHATGSHPMAKLYWNSGANKTAANNPWFNIDAPHPFSVFHDYNHEYQGTRDYFKRVLQYWIQEYKLDGYRLDLTKGFTQKSSNESTASRYDQSRIDILTDYYEATKAVKSDVMFILEHFCDNDEETVLANKGMYLWRNVNNAYSQAAMGYKADSSFGGMNSSPRRWVGFAESHDEERNFYKAKTWGEGAVKTDSVYRIQHRVPLNIAFTVLTPGPKMLWQFQEVGFDYSIESFGGRTANKPPVWSWIENLAHRKAAYTTSSKIITLRKMFPNAFTQGQYSLQIGAGDWDQGKRIALTHGDLNLVVLGNFKPNDPITAYPNFSKIGIWYNVLDGTSLDVSNTNMSIQIPPGRVMIYADREINFPNGVNDPTEDPVTNVLYPSVTNGKVFVDAHIQNEVGVYNLSGDLMQRQVNIQEIDLTGYAGGLYLIRVQTPDRTFVGKVVKY